MILLLIFAFIAGLVTVLSPCILPVLPLVLSGSVGGKSRPYGVVVGFVASFTFFTLFLASIVRATGLSVDALRILSIVVIFTLGISQLVPAFQALIEQFFGRLAGLTRTTGIRQGFWGGVLLGLSLGLIWTPCVGPILASVITLALTGSVNGGAVLITLAYATGTAIPMLAVISGGQQLLARLKLNPRRIQITFGILMIATAVAIAGGVDRKLQLILIDRFPQWGTGLIQLENRPEIRQQLGDMPPTNPNTLGKPSFMLLQDLGNAPELTAGGEWFNTEPLTMQGLRGKVVLVDFWTYTCINCIRTLPYLRTWYDKYASSGLVIVGVHAPEFEFEKKAENVKSAIADYQIKYPVMQDNAFATWNAFGNHFWPAKYLIDKNGRIRYTHFGEGGYDETEEAIQQLLTEAGASVTEKIANPDYQISAQTPETYLGRARAQNFASPEEIKLDSSQTYSMPDNLSPNSWAISGSWSVGLERSMPEAGSRLELNFEAQNVFLVMRPKDGTGKLKVFLDDQPVTIENAGEDVKDGAVLVEQDRLYRLIKLPFPGKHRLRLEFEDNQLELYAFTFG